MKKGLAIAIVAAGTAALFFLMVDAFAAGAGDFQMQTASVTNKATAAAQGNTENGLQGEAGTDALFSAHGGSNVILTNCAVWDGSNLPYANTNYTLSLKVGNNAEGVVSYAGIWNMATTSFWAEITIPNHTGTVYCQTWVYDENTNLYIYPAWEITVVEPLR